MTIYVIFDQYGDQVFFTKDNKYANFDNMYEPEFIKDKCYIAKDIPGFTGKNRQACLIDISTGEITLYTRSKSWKPKRDILNQPEKEKNLKQKLDELSSSFNDYKIQDKIFEKEQENKQILNSTNIEQLNIRLNLLEEQMCIINILRNKQEKITQIIKSLTKVEI